MNYDAAISDPASFHGRAELLKRVCDGPQRIHLLLGGRKAGKTSLLYRISSAQLDCQDKRKKFLPVYLQFRADAPKNFADFLGRLLLPAEAIAQLPTRDFPWESSGSCWARQVLLKQAGLPQEIDWRDFETRLLESLTALADKGFTGVLFLLDDCESFLREDWFLREADSRLEAMKQSPVYCERVGFIFAGYRDLRDLQQRVGSRLLEMAAIEWLEPLSRQDVAQLIEERVHSRHIDERDRDDIFEYAGGHPFLTQHLISQWIESKGEPVATVAKTCIQVLLPAILQKWWSGGKRAGNGFTAAEREAYFALTQADALTPLDASDMIGRSEVDCRIAMQALCGSCIVRRVGLGLGVYSLGARIFSEWVMQGSAPPRVPGKPANTRRGSKCSRFVISIHGIRTRGEWQKLLTRAMGREFTHEPWDYGDFSFLRLLRPGQRARQIDRFRDDYHRMRTDCGAIPSVVAHSFGTYIVANAMEKYPEICFDQMIFCGSIVPPDFRWSGFDEQRFARMLHDYGCLDIWAKLVEWVVPDAGGSGSWGFKDKAGGRIVERQHPLFDHSSYFYLGNFTENWIPFLSGRDPRSQPVPRLQEIRKWKVRLVALLGAVLLAGLVLVGFGW